MLHLALCVVANFVLHLAFCVVAKSVLRLASFFAESVLYLALCGRSAVRVVRSRHLSCAAFHGFVARLFAALLCRPLRFFVAFASSRLCAVGAILLLKHVAKARSLGLLFDRCLHREGIVTLRTLNPLV